MGKKIKVAAVGWNPDAVDYGKRPGPTPEKLRAALEQALFMPADSKHPATPVSAGLRFLSELVAWIAGPWAVALASNWLVLPMLILLVGLPAVFSTPNDKRQVIVPTPGTVRVGIELLLYCVAAIAPWFVWPAAASGLAVTIVAASLVTGIPRFIWLIDGAPAASASSNADGERRA